MGLLLERGRVGGPVTLGEEIPFGQRKCLGKGLVVGPSQAGLPEAKEVGPEGGVRQCPRHPLQQPQPSPGVSWLVGQEETKDCLGHSGLCCRDRHSEALLCMAFSFESCAVIHGNLGFLAPSVYPELQ